jgi:hypothetical protein
MNHFLMFGRSIAAACTTKNRSIAMKTLTPLEQLQEKLWLKALPENIDIPTGPARDLIVTKPVAHATVDDLAFAQPGIGQQGDVGGVEMAGVMGGEGSDIEESHEDGLLEYPHYTRPRDFEGRGIPEVLTSGNHASIARWRRAEAEMLTKARRPDLHARKFPPKG